MWKQQELRKRKWDGKERESVSEDILLSWTPPDIKNNWEPDPVGPSGEVKIFPQLPSPADQRLGPPASTSHPPPAFQDNAYVSAEWVLSECWDFSHLSSSREAPGQTGERSLSKHSERLCLHPTQIGNTGCPRPRQKAPQQRKWSSKSSQGSWSEARPWRSTVVHKRRLKQLPNILPSPRRQKPPSIYPSCPALNIVNAGLGYQEVSNSGNPPSPHLKAILELGVHVLQIQSICI